MRRHGDRRLRARRFWPNVLTIAALAFLGVACGPTGNQFSQMRTAFGAVHLPSDFTLLFKQDSGSAGMLSDQGPEELRIYRLEPRPDAPAALQKALAAAGFTTDRPYECSFGALRRPVLVTVIFYEQDPRPMIRGGGSNFGAGCPTTAWNAAYAWIVVGYVGNQPSVLGPTP